MFGSTADDECFNEIINSQTNNGNFKCRELISGPFKIKLSEKNIDSLKNYAEKLCLRRLENSVWITSLIIVYFEIVLAKYKSDSKWSSAYNSAKNLVQQSVRNHKYEKELHDACEKYLLRLDIQIEEGSATNANENENVKSSAKTPASTELESPDDLQKIHDHLPEASLTLYNRLGENEDKVA
ncbi:hypothetical protein RhiirA5_461657 [Rhizophagus irregularis]|uniref:Uncharacterized protein n=2 Tax=Rhizophagus irregularis TaxID=588596 RepID=A0A2N0NY18_9GLOM|nr:hypothetical protein GLOIN_2v1480580 [Rhizophagus irregularis DAOM 181602=DAOM 197198]PKB99465.1 hypothetical protein RhiirA5_461657 [Rhizophagus irregularis]PKC62205.1 hypothetical protein RhiirA1_397828 [Rhizophagus irregularis]POG68747.1 hypothetical protein GLOIN_2v1480580 [Rhizophagus irregularis DAOM 181602=DAOM 197198]|eukprot:XP_025175613.1 hypothetical protein GLOIN_2v1480580 [Rhizophagus irregularis DAOM 181602=DAOM 197198]